MNFKFCLWVHVLHDMENIFISSTFFPQLKLQTKLTWHPVSLLCLPTFLSVSSWPSFLAEWKSNGGKKLKRTTFSALTYIEKMKGETLISRQTCDFYITTWQDATSSFTLGTLSNNVEQVIWKQELDTHAN